MNTKARTAYRLAIMGFIVQRHGADALVISHELCPKSQVVCYGVQGLQQAHNWLCQTADREKQGWAEAVARSRDYLAEVCR